MFGIVPAGTWIRLGSRDSVVDKGLLDILACPVCKTRVELRPPAPGDDAQARLICTSCGRRYPVRDDIPIMLIDEADTPDGAGNSK